MKRSVTICDRDHCRTLADSVCPLCEKDFCQTHIEASLYAEICVTRPASLQPGQQFQPGQEKYDKHNVQALRISICSGCYQDLHDTQSGQAPKFVRTRVLESLAEGLKPQMIEACRAGLAAHKLLSE